MEPILELCEEDAGSPEGRRIRDLILFDCEVKDGVVRDRGAILDPSVLKMACIPADMQGAHIRAFWGQFLQV